MPLFDITFSTFRGMFLSTPSSTVRLSIATSSSAMRSVLTPDAASAATKDPMDVPATAPYLTSFLCMSSIAATSAKDLKPPPQNAMPTPSTLDKTTPFVVQQTGPRSRALPVLVPISRGIRTTAPQDGRSWLSEFPFQSFAGEKIMPSASWPRARTQRVPTGTRVP